MRMLTVVALLFTVLGCLKPQGEHTGAQTPSERASPPPTRPNDRTDGPTNPRSAPMRPPEPEQRGEEGGED